MYDGNNWIDVTATVYNGTTTKNALGFTFAPVGSSPDVDADDSDDSGGSAGMFEATAALGKAFVSGVWSLFGIYVPGFSFTLIFGFGGGAPRGVGTRTGSTNRPKISRERRNDEF